MHKQNSISPVCIYKKVFHRMYIQKEFHLKNTGKIKYICMQFYSEIGLEYQSPALRKQRLCALRLKKKK